MSNHWLVNVIDSIAERGRELLGLESTKSGPLNLHQLCQQLLSGHGEASRIALSQEILSIYNACSDDEKTTFFEVLAHDYDPNPEEIRKATDKYLKSHTATDLIKLTLTVEAPRQELFRRLNMAPHGTASLVTLRADLLARLKENPELISVDADLKHILSSWFNHGFLQLHSIDWKSPAHILEKLINYESVHEIQGWDDLRRRLMKDRRCVAFFHPAMPDEPLIFIEVALVQGLSSEIKTLINPETPVLEPQRADTAIFYSINNTQTGLRGISFGNFLIKQVLTELARDCPWIKTSSTLSPIPSFATALQSWLQSKNEQPNYALFDAVIERHANSINLLAESQTINTTRKTKDSLAEILDKTMNHCSKELSAILSELALIYIITPNNKGKLPDPVALFHLSNGARLERINTCADMSNSGIKNSYGIMVNYLYDIEQVEKNHEAFVSSGLVSLSDNLAKLAKAYI